MLRILSPEFFKNKQSHVPLEFTTHQKWTMVYVLVVGNNNNLDVFSDVCINAVKNIKM